MPKKVTILIPNYKTPDLTKLCLRLIKKYTPLDLAHIMVIDNGSQDASLDYLKSLDWIELLERTPLPEEGTALSHSLALDLGLQHCQTEFVLSIHTDTLVKDPTWLEYLLSVIEADPKIAGVGSWKMEHKPWYKKCLKTIESWWQKNYYRLIGKTSHRLIDHDDNYRYLRSHCALYRTALLKKQQLTFADGTVAGKGLHKKLVDSGYQMIFLPTHILEHYLSHINHATIILNPELGGRRRTLRIGMRRVKKQLESLSAKEVSRPQ